MIYILIILTIALLFYSYYDFGYLLHPIVIVYTMFALSLIVVGSNYNQWGDISGTTFAVILLYLVAFGLGGNFGNRILFTTRNGNNQLSVAKQLLYPPEIRVNKLCTIIISIFTIYTTVENYRMLRTLSGVNLSGLMAFVSAARYLTYTGDLSIGYPGYFQQLLYLCRVLALIYVYIIAYKIIVQKEKIFIFELVPVFSYVIQAILTTGRADLLRFIFEVLMLVYCLYMNERNWVKRNDFHYIKQIFIGVIVAVIFFSIVVSNRHGQNAISSAINNYIGSSIIALNIYISKNGIFSISSYWGEETQALYYSIAKSLFHVDKTAKYILEPIYFGKIKTMTNVYTSIRRYLYDYGIFVTLVIAFLLGFLYAYLFKKIRITSNNGLRILVYAFLSYPLMEIAIEERFLSNLVTARTLFCLFYLVLLYKIFFNKPEYSSVEYQDI